MKLHILPTPAKAAAACATEILHLLGAAIADRGIASLAVSGGTTPKLMFEAMTPAACDWSRVHLFFVDERAVPPDDEQSNFRLASDNLIERVHLPHANLHRIHAELAPEEAAARYVDELRSFFGHHDPVFDVVQLGMGPDAHTASLFPGEPMVADRAGVAAALYVTSKKQWRITLLPKAILAARARVFLATGEDKATALHRVLDGKPKSDRYPAQIAAQVATWFVDAAAAAKLAPR